MINTTFTSLNVLSMISISPIFTLYSIHNGNLHSTFYNLHVSHSFTNIISSYSVNHKIFLKNCFISNTLNSAIKLSKSRPSNYEIGEPIDKQSFSTNQVFNGDCGNITITACTFDNCQSTDLGGSLHIQQDCHVIIHGTLFKNSHTSSSLGAACFIVKEKGQNGPPNFNDQMLKRLDVQYCCFDNCYGTGSGLYGVALFVAADQTILFYTSSVNCPGNDKSASEGAQFDIQANNVSSQQVNASNGHSNYCGAIEYRYAKAGSFKFETICDIMCMFGIAYTGIEQKNLDLSMSNMIKVTIKRYVTNDNKESMINVYSGLIHVRDITSITISNFCFMDNTFMSSSEDDPKIISRGTDGTGEHKLSKIKVILKNCFYDCTDEYVAVNIDENDDVYQELIDCSAQTKTQNEIPQLNLGECKGDVTPPPFVPIPTNAFSESDKFTESDGFTKSDELTKSDVFTKSDPLTQSSQFTSSFEFSQSNEWINSSSLDVILIPDDTTTDKKTNVGMIAGVSVAAAAVVAGIIALVIFLIKRHNLPNIDEDIETLDENANALNNSNPIYNANGEEDPFKEDF